MVTCVQRDERGHYREGKGVRAIRRRLSPQIEKIDNQGLHAGSPMYFYCHHCGIPTEVLPEDFVFPPTLECSQCQGLKTEGWLESAIEMAG